MAQIHLDRLEMLKRRTSLKDTPMLYQIVRRLADLADDNGYIYLQMDMILGEMKGEKQLKYQVIGRLHRKGWLNIPEWHTPRFLMEEGKIRYFRLTLPLTSEKTVVIFRQDVYDALRTGRRIIQEIDQLASTDLRYSNKSAEVILGEIALITRAAAKRVEKVDKSHYDEFKTDQHSKPPEAL